MLVVAGCGENTEKPGVNNNSEPTRVEQQASAGLDENKLELAKAGDVTLLTNKQSDNDIFKEITVRTKDKSKTFPWVNVTNSTYYPIVNITDVNADGKKEVVVFCSTGTGTGFHEQEIHVLNKEDLTEIIVENPFETIRKKVNSKITKNNGKVNVVVKWDGKKIEKTYNESDAVQWEDRVFFPRVTYQLVDNTIYAIMVGYTTPALVAVVAIVEYGSDLKARNITVKDIDKTNYPDVIDGASIQ